ncbi:FtsX-like permease family protein [Nocardioides conyzicola]|uniref:ABC3 transporter permease C-terminal domain-containing protein n=1 Tax=Nocardioides conyzicola TaxID=1651781 RepID=A0ABP8XA13_9ACTN
MRTGRDVRLAITLVRGAGRRDAVRLVAMAFGVALAVYAALVGIAAPRVATAAHEVEVDRAPVLSEQSAAHGLRIQSASITVHDRVWTRATVTGAGSRAPRPPGVAQWPASGESIVSPALRDLAEADPDVAATIGPIAPATIGAAGLTGPDELFSYTAAGQEAGAHAPGQADRRPVVTAFHNPAAVTSGGLSFLVVIELALLVLAPAAIFLLTALRLSAVSRSKRTFALGLAGMSPSRTARLYAWEMSVVAVAGFVVGTAAYETTQAPLGSSGWLGVYWWPDQGALGGAAVLVAGVATVVVVNLTARRSMRIEATRTRSQRGRRPGRISAAVGLVLGVPSVGFLAVVALNGWLHPSTRWTNDTFAGYIAVAVLAGVGAIIIGIPSLIAGLGDAAASRTGPTFALGLRGAAYRVTTSRRLVAFVSCAVMLAGLSAAFLASLHRGAFGDPDEATVTFEVASIRADPHWLRDLPAGPYTIETSVRTPAGGMVSVEVGDCEAVERQAATVFLRPGPCVDAVQLGPGSGTGAPQTVTIAGHRLHVPAAGETSDVSWSLKFPVQDAGWARDLEDGDITYWVSRSDGTYDSTVRALTTTFPDLRIDAGLKNADQYAVYRQQAGTVRAAAALGILLSVCSFLLTSLESRWERTRSVMALSAIGTRQRVLRGANLVEFVFPVLVAAVPAAVVGILGGWAILSFRGSDGMFSAGIVEASCAGVLAAVAIAGLAGWGTGKAEFDREAIADT